LEVWFQDEEGSTEAHGLKLPSLSPRSRRCIPRAISVHPSYFEAGDDSSKYYPRYSCPEDGNLLSDALLHVAIARLGITEDTPVVVYGKGFVATMAACRVLWALLYAGVRDAKLLDGGLEEWLRHGGELAAHPATPVAAVQFSESGQCVKAFLATDEQVGRVSREEIPGVTVDVRKIGEYEGWFRDNYGFFTTAGHIPGCVYQGNWDELVDMATQKLRPVEEVEARWELLGLSKDRGPIIFYCGTGWRSSVSFVIAYMLGWDAKNYDSGWYTTNSPLTLRARHDKMRCRKKVSGLYTADT